jgi:hypothetical protein
MAFLISIGFTQSCVDRILFFLAATAEIPDGMMALAILVDDTFVFSVNESVKQRAKTLWEARFGKSSVPDGRTTEFGGLYIVRPVPGVAEISCRRLCLDFADRLTPFPLPSHARCETSMAADALTLLRTPVSIANPLMGPAHTEAARALLGRTSLLRHPR